MEMDDDCLIVSEDIRSPPVSKIPLIKVNPLMKTKQARLPFVRVPAKSHDATHAEPSKTTSAAGRKEGKKRKLSGSAQTVAEQPKNKKRTTVSSASRKRASPEVEVSSSSDEVITAPRESSEDKPNTSGSSLADKRPKSPLPSCTSAFLQKFVKKKPTQQDEVSTSVEHTSDKDVLEECSNASVSGVKEKVILIDKSEPLKGQGSSPVIEDQNQKESHCPKSDDSKITKAQAETRRNSILEAIEIAINQRRPSVQICADDRDAAEKELANQGKKRKLSGDSGKLPVSEKENMAKPPSPKKSKNLLTAFIQRGIKSCAESARGKGASSDIKNDKNLVTPPRILKQGTSGDSNLKSCDACDKSEGSRSINSDTDTKKGEKLASDAETNTISSGEERDSSSSDETDDATPSKKKSDDEAELIDDKTPSISADKSEKTPMRSRVRDSDGCAVENKDTKSNCSETPKLPCKKLTPKAQAKLAEKKQRQELRLMKHEEKIKQKQEKDEEKAKKEAERLKVKEEKKAELEKQRKEKEEQRKKKQEEHDAKSKEREEKRKKIEEEKRVKEEEKRAKEEEKRKAEQEEEERKKKVAEKFVNFFKPGKEEPSGKTIAIKDHHSGPFQQMQVSRYTALAPLQRVCLTEESRIALDKYIVSSSNGSPASKVKVPTYLGLLRSGDHKPLSSSVTPPTVIVKDDKDDCVIIEHEVDDEDEEEDDLEYAGEGMVVCEKAAVDPKNHKGKLLKFCENRRPAYWGTWTKKPTAVRPRRPFAKEEIFDYEYDSDDDWEEEEENGESLSDSEGEKEDEEDEQYEVDNDFFVPHGYLSDDEGQEDEENLDGGDGAQCDSEPKASTGILDNKEKLKAKQAEFEKELKMQMKQLKPRVLGCLWLHGDEQSSGAAFDHLHRVMSGYSAVVCVPPPAEHDSAEEADTQTDAPADSSSVSDEKNLVGGMRSWHLTFPGITCVVPSTPQPDPLATPADADTPLTSTGVNGSQKRKFFKTFPEEAIPSLIRLIHGNRNGQLYIVKEFLHFWQKQRQSESASERQEPSSTPSLSPHVWLSKKKIKDKLIELASYKRCPDEGPFYNQSMWYVDASVREQYGVRDAALPNDWSYCTAVPKTNRVKEDGSSTGESPGPCRATNLISKFTKILSDEEKAVLIANKNAGKNASMSRENAADDVQEIKADSEGVSGSKTPGNGKKRSNPAKTPARNNLDKMSTSNGRKTAKSSLKLTPKSSPLLAFFKTPPSSDFKKANSKSPRVKATLPGKDSCPDGQCITID